MGVASCTKLCSHNEYEIEKLFFTEKELPNKNNDLNNENNNNIKNDEDNNNDIEKEEIKEIKKEPTKLELFKEKFESRLPDFGNHIEKQQFTEKIPENIQNYMIENSFQIPEHIKLNENIYEIGPIQFKNGNLYEGNWNESIVMDGTGRYYIDDGNLFIEGIWNNGKSIYGRIFYPNNNIYIGDIKDSSCHGKGKLIFENGNIYEGDFVEGEIEGEGVYTFQDGTTYEGKFSKSDLKGHGIMKWTNGIIYEGEFDGTTLNNFGKLTGNNEEYEGNFMNNFFNGKGKYTFNDGSIYEGDFDSGYKSGTGKFTKKDEFIYEGSWSNNFPHGFGTFTYNNIIIKGIWRNGINAEISKKEGDINDDFNPEMLNFKVPNQSLKPETSPNLNIMSSIKNFGYEKVPSYLKSIEEN